MPTNSLIGNVHSNFNHDRSSWRYLLPLCLPLTFPSRHTFKYHAVSQVIDNRLFASDVLFYLVALADDSNFNIVELRWDNFYGENTLSISKNGFVAKEAGPYLIILNFHDPISFYPKMVYKLVVLIYCQGQKTAFGLLYNHNLIFFELFLVIFDQLINITISNQSQQGLPAFRTFPVGWCDRFDALPAIGVMVFTGNNRLSFGLIVILHAYTASDQAFIDLDLCSFTLTNDHLFLYLVGLVVFVSFLWLWLLAHEFTLVS